MAGQHILVVDDEPDTLKLVGLVLIGQGYRVSKAETGAQALAAARTDVPDLIVLDVMLPDMDGYAIARALRNDPRTTHVSIVMFTAKGRIDDKAAGYEAGVDDYVTKPAHPADLLARVKAVLAQQEAAPNPLDTAGTVLVVLAATPGAGATTVALNVGAALAEGQRGGVQVAGFAADPLLAALGGEAPVLPADPAPDDVRDVLVEVTAGLSVLPGPADGYERQHGEAVVRALAAAGSTVIDIGTLLNASTYALLLLADGIIIVVEPTRKSLGACRRIVRGLHSDGLSGKLSVVLVHKPHCADPVNVEAIKAGLNVTRFATIPSLPYLIADPMPLVTRVPDHPAADALRQFADDIIPAD